MIFKSLEIAGAFLLEREKLEDHRGYFARVFCENEFKSQGINFQPAQANISYNTRKHTLRGMHFQISPHEEEKLVYCTSGSIFDVIVDIRENTTSFGKWCAVELSRENGKGLYIPKGCAHGFLTLEDNSEVTYLMSPAYKPGFESGFNWADANIGIQWPATPTVISEKDQMLPSFDEALRH
ncbi:dTDP-4-dehydrorhamnose 3,5-epimerase [Sneathiella glossodoripedis]|uniref:dTDP-4-dehydrorhamnose 3,5-epimerase n=1 Tax=Sneathiella glossodoripedis TaxID=418853 RepID=UPI00047114A4|nr:dTDP-4-dehydrorhamnose 3,5-epimerase [Sneathiella glossodoripedis]